MIFTWSIAILVLISIQKGGVADTHQVARHVLTDWNGGKIPYYTIPPSSKKSHIEASVVNTWGKELDLDLASADIVLSGLKSSNEFGSSVVMVIFFSGIYGNLNLTKH